MWVRTHLITERYCSNLHNILLIKRLNSALAIAKKRFVLFLPATIFQIWRIYLLSRKLLDTVYFQQVLSCLSCALVSHGRKNESLLCSDHQCYNYVKLSQEWEKWFLDSESPVFMVKGGNVWSVQYREREEAVVESLAGAWNALFWMLCGPGFGGVYDPKSARWPLETPLLLQQGAATPPERARSHPGHIQLLLHVEKKACGHKHFNLVVVFIGFNFLECCF